MLALIGSVAGVVPVAIGLAVAPVRGLRMGPVSSLELSPAAVVVSLAIGLLVGLSAGLWPAYQALRLRTGDALRRVA